MLLNIKSKTCNVIMYNRVLPSVCLILTVGGMLKVEQTKAASYYNPAFLKDDVGDIADLSRFYNDEGQLPGKYNVRVFVNERFINEFEVKFISSKNKSSSGLKPVFTKKNITEIGVIIDPEKLKQLDDEIDLSKVDESIIYDFDFDRLQLKLSVPQVFINNIARGYISPDKWDDGINALFLNYNMNGATGWGEDETQNIFTSINSGVNVGAWRLRDYSNFVYSKGYSGSQNDIEHLKTVAQRSFRKIKSKFTLGDDLTSGDVFDSFAFRGVSLESDDSMLPDSLRGFAPTIKGLAKSNAKVTVKQNDYIIYQAYVPPGPFEISDLYSTSSSGDLFVTVSERNGMETSFTVPYSTVPILQREGKIKYAMSAGRLNTNTNVEEERQFYQGNVIFGLKNSITLYSGTQLSKKYKSYALGVGHNFKEFGAFSADITHSDAILTDSKKTKGTSLRFLYAKSLNNLGTNLQLVGYRYSSSGFYTFEESSLKDQVDIDSGHYSDLYILGRRKKSRLQASISQQLFDNSSIYLSGQQSSYWNGSEKDQYWQMGYATTYKNVNLNISFNYNNSANSDNVDKMFMLSVSLPLNSFLGQDSGGDITKRTHSLYATYNSTIDSGGNLNNQAGLSGTALKDDNLNYYMRQGYVSKDAHYSGSLGASYQGAKGNIDGSYYYDSKNSQLNYGVSGGVVAHSGGVTLSQPLGETNILVNVPQSKDIQIDNMQGIKTNNAGYAILPFATNYRENRISLNTNTFDENTEVENPIETVVPTRGALVLASFKSQIGDKAILKLMQNGKAVPFGAAVTYGENKSYSIVGDDGEVYVTGLNDGDKLNVSWGSTDSKRCFSHYRKNKHLNEASIIRETLPCVN